MFKKVLMFKRVLKKGVLVDQGVWVIVSFPKVLNGWAGTSQDYFVSQGNEFTDVTLV